MGVDSLGLSAFETLSLDKSSLSISIMVKLMSYHEHILKKTASEVALFECAYSLDYRSYCKSSDEIRHTSGFSPLTC